MLIEKYKDIVKREPNLIASSMFIVTNDNVKLISYVPSNKGKRLIRAFEKSLKTILKQEGFYSNSNPK